MIKIDLLDYAIYADGNHMADFDAKGDALAFCKHCIHNSDYLTIVIISNFTGEIVATFNVVTEVKTKVKEWVAE